MGRPGAIVTLLRAVGVRFDVRFRYRHGYVGFRTPHAEARHFLFVVVGEKVLPPFLVLATQQAIQEIAVFIVKQNETSA